VLDSMGNGGRGALREAQPSKRPISFGPFELDCGQGELRKKGVRVKLQDQPCQILQILLERPGEIVTRDELRNCIWPADTFVDFDKGLYNAVKKLREALGDTAGTPRFIETVPKKGYRFIAPVNVDSLRPKLVELERPDQESVETAAIEEPSAELHKPQFGLKIWKSVAIAIALLVAAATAITLRMQRRHVLGDADMVLVSDFVNTTGEPIFDGTLKQALTVKLAESPYFNVVPESVTGKILSLMGRSPRERLVAPVAAEVCQREGAKVMVGGSILSVGNKYVLNLDATNCLTGESLAHQEIDAVNREQVLRQLGQAIPPLRRKLGESLNSLQKFDAPIEQATTTSLAALKAYAEGDEKRALGQDAESIPSYKMAIDLDPEFAIAYARLGAVYINLRQNDLGSSYLKQAFERRTRLSEREKLYVQVHYYADATGELDKAIETYEFWTRVYPHDWIPFNNLSNDYNIVGNLNKAVIAGQQALLSNPEHAFPYGVLGRAYERASKNAEAKAICKKAKEQKLDGWGSHSILYDIAFIENDKPAMQRELDWFKGNPLESWVISTEAWQAMSMGRVHEARRLFDQARTNALKNDLKEMAESFALDEAHYEADLGNIAAARLLSQAALSIAPDSAAQDAVAALVFARAGDIRRADALAEQAFKKNPLDLLMNSVTLACVRATAEMDKKNPAAAISDLQRAAPFDLSVTSNGETTYYRGYAFLQMNSGVDAAAQFQRIIDNRGATGFYWPLAHLGLARAYRLSGERDKSLGAYREFLELWKDADPDLLALREARAEYKQVQ